MVFSPPQGFPFIFQRHVRMRSADFGAGVAALALLSYLWCGNH